MEEYKFVLLTGINFKAKSRSKTQTYLDVRALDARFISEQLNEGPKKTGTGMREQMKDGLKADYLVFSFGQQDVTGMLSLVFQSLN